jgi:histone H3/H4
MAEEFTNASMRRLLRKHGDLRISDSSAEELRHAVGVYGSKVAKAAVAHAIEEGRKTVLDRDIRAVIEADIGGKIS